MFRMTSLANWRKAVDRGAKLEAKWKEAVRGLCGGES